MKRLKNIMRPYHKRNLYTVGLFLLMLTLMSGCGKIEEETTSTTEYTENEYANISLFSDVDFWMPPQWDTDEETITGKISQKTGVVVDVTIPIQNADKQLSLMIVNDNLPDVISITDGTVISQLVTSGKVWRMDEFFQKYLPDSHVLTKFPQDIKEELIRRDGAWYAWPSHMTSEDSAEIWPFSDQCYEELNQYCYNNAIIWNRKLLKKLELNVDELTEEVSIMNAFEKAKQYGEASGEDVIPLLIDGQDYQGSTFYFLEDTFGALPIDDAGNYSERILQPEAKKAMEFLNQAIRRGYMDADQMTYPNNKIKNLFAEGQVLCFIGNIANTSLDATKWVSSGPILSDTGIAPVYSVRSKPSTGWMSTFISKDCEEPEKIAAWIDYMTSEEGMMLFEFGIEGKDYTLDSHGLVKFTEEIQDARNNYSKTGILAWWPFVNTSWERSVLAPFKKDSYDEQDAKLHTAYKKYKKAQTYDVSLLEFTLNVENAELDASVQEYQKQEITKVILSSDENCFNTNYQSMINGLRKIGILQLNEVKNEQYLQNCSLLGTKIDPR